jgi:hypothetical protein
MTFDLDPDGDFAPGSREYYFQIERDAASVTPWRLGENTPITGMNYEFRLSGYNVIRSTNYPLAFSDPNVWASGLSSGGFEYLDLSDADNQYTKRLENDTSGDTPPHSILSKVNSIWTCTVGDGNASFGDFNGDDAIHQAIAYFNANVVDVNASQGIHIRCKSGTYLVNAANGPILVPDGVTCVIEGLVGSKYGFQPQAEITSDQSITIDFAGTNQSLLRLISIEINTVSVANFSDIVVPRLQHIEAQNCLFKTISIKFEDANDCLFENCSFQSSGFADRAIIHIEAGDGNPFNTTHGPFRFVDCNFNGGQDHPIVRVRASAFDIPRTTINSIEFYRCEINVGYTDATAGALTGNSGLLDFDPNGSSWWRNFPNEGLEVREIIWEECHVTNQSVVAPVHVLMHCIPVANGTVLAASLDEQFVNLHRAIIRGGRWAIESGQDTGFTPFVLVAGSVEISHVVMGWEQPYTDAVYGGPTAELGYWFTGVFGAPAEPSPRWGAFAVFAQDLFIDNVTFTGLTQRSTAGDLFLRYTKLYMKDVSMTSYSSGGTGSTPDQRIRLRAFLPTAGASGRGLIQNVDVGVNNPAVLAPVGTDWANEAIIYYEPSLYSFTFDNVRMGPWPIDSGSTVADGILFPEANTGDFYTGSTISYANVKITGCVITGCYNGIHYNGDGDSGAQGFADLVISECQIGECYNNGIYLEADNSTGFMTSVVINNNVSILNINYGVYLSLSEWEFSSFVIADNAVNFNRTDASDSQIVVDVSVPSLSGRPRGTIIGNDCSWAGVIGGILVNHGVVGRVPVALGGTAIYGDIVDPNAPFTRGIHTGFLASTNDTYRFRNVPTYVSPDVIMVENVAYLHSGVTP